MKRFKDWFSEKFGKRPSSKPIPELTKEYRDLKLLCDKKLHELEATIRWENHKDTAQLSWSAAKILERSEK